MKLLPLFILKKKTTKMIITVKNEAPFQVLTNAFTIGPSPTGYELQVGATSKEFTTLFSVGANTPRMVTNVANGSYFRLKNNVGDVKVNWERSCDGGGGGGGTDYTAGEYISLENDVISVTGITPDEYLTTADTQDFVTEADITAATNPIQEQLDDVERVTATALTELHDAIVELSGLTEDFATETYVDDAIQEAISGLSPDLPSYLDQEVLEAKEEVIASAITELHNQVLEISGGTGGGGSVVELTKAQYEALGTAYTENTTYIITDADVIDMDDYALATAVTDSLSTKADKQNVAPNTGVDWFPTWNEQGVITGVRNSVSVNIHNINGISIISPIYYGSNNWSNLYAPTSAGTAGQPLLSNGSGAPVWGGYKFLFMTQTEYDALVTKDSAAIYFITGD